MKSFITSQLGVPILYAWLNVPFWSISFICKRMLTTQTFRIFSHERSSTLKNKFSVLKPHVTIYITYIYYKIHVDWTHTVYSNQYFCMLKLKSPSIKGNFLKSSKLSDFTLWSLHYFRCTVLIYYERHFSDKKNNMIVTEQGINYLQCR